MKQLYLEGTKQNPKVVLDKEKNIFEFSGQSLPENAREVYLPIIKWVEDYAAQPNQKTDLLFKMKYFNTASSKVIFELLKKFNKIHLEGAAVHVLWHYKSDDEDMYETGKYYADLVEMPFEFVAYD